MRPEGGEEIALFKSQCEHLILGQQSWLKGIALPVDMPKLLTLEYGMCKSAYAYSYGLSTEQTIRFMTDHWQRTRGQGIAIPVLRIYTAAMLEQHTGCAVEDWTLFNE